MTELELKLSLPDELAAQAKAAGLLTSEALIAELARILERAKFAAKLTPTACLQRIIR